jgi:hypothetical protein
VALPEDADVIDAMERFLAGIEPFDPDPGVPVMTVELRAGRSRGSFALTGRAATALREVLLRHVDPDDCGRCDGCGGHLDRDLRCVGCGQVAGVFGATVARFVAGSTDPRRP